MAYVKRLQTAEDSSSCSESDQSFRSSGIYSGKGDCTFSDSESSKIDAMEPADILHDSDSSGSVSNRAIQQLSGKQITVTYTQEFGSPLNAPFCFTTGIDFVAEDSNKHADKLMDECTKLGSIPIEFDADGKMKSPPKFWTIISGPLSSDCSLCLSLCSQPGKFLKE